MKITLIFFIFFISDKQFNFNYLSNVLHTRLYIRHNWNSYSWYERNIIKTYRIFEFEQPSLVHISSSVHNLPVTLSCHTRVCHVTKAHFILGEHKVAGGMIERAAISCSLNRPCTYKHTPTYSVSHAHEVCFSCYFILIRKYYLHATLPIFSSYITLILHGINMNLMYVMLQNEFSLFTNVTKLFVHYDRRSWRRSTTLTFGFVRFTVGDSDGRVTEVYKR